MRILLTGANGFIGSHLTAALLAAGHEVVGCVRDPRAFERRFPAAEAMQADLNHDIADALWLPRLTGIDAVINCAGILQDQRGQSAKAIHHLAPAALFDACVTAGVRRVIQVSAISATSKAGTPYALTKLAADDHLRGLDLDWTVLRPSLVYAEGSYGGTSLLRAFAAMPFVLPVMGSGDQMFQPLHVADLGRTVIVCLSSKTLAGRTLDPVGPEMLSFSDILIKLRAWLGLQPAPVLPMPRAFVALVCRLGDVLQAGPLRTTSLKQIEHGNGGDSAAFIAAIGFTPRSLDQALAASPAGVQDRWHARLYLVTPLLTTTLVLLWLGSGLLGLCLPAVQTTALLVRTSIPAGLAAPLTLISSLLDLTIAAALLVGVRRKLLGQLQLLIVLGYTLFLTATLPALWADPLGPLLKNLPVLAAILVWTILAEER